MSPTNLKMRVGAISHTTHDDTVYFFGYGVYIGDVPCPALRELPNPKIELDAGGIVWGCECWWGPEEQVRKYIGTRKVVMQPLPERKKTLDELVEMSEDMGLYDLDKKPPTEGTP